MSGTLEKIAQSPVMQIMRNRINLSPIPFTERGSRLLLLRNGQRLFVRLAERWLKWEQEVGNYRSRPPILVDFEILVDGAPLPFEVETYPHLVRLHTALGAYDWAFYDTETLLVRLPRGVVTLRFALLAERAETDRRGGTLHGKRNSAYTTNAVILANQIQPLGGSLNQIVITVDAADGDGFLLNITPRLGFNRSIPDPDEAIEASRARWQAWFDAVPPVLERYRAQYYYAWWVMRAGLLAQRFYFTREALAPSKIHYVGVWHWDQFFHAFAYRHVDIKLAEDQIRILVDHQQPNGMFPDAVHDEGLIMHLLKPVDADVTKPPLMAWTVLSLYEKSGRIDFLEEMYEPLRRWQRWWLTENVAPNGLCLYRHPFSSGLDDSPLWDDGMPVIAPDLNTYIILQCECLARIADLIGLPDDAAEMRSSAERLTEALLTYLWDDEAGVFNYLHDGKKVDVFTPFHLLPLWTGRLPPAITERLIARLTDPATLWVRYPIPSVAVNDPKFNAAQMWRGPTWVNINYLFVKALTKAGRTDLAGELRRKTLDLLMQHDDIYEYYDPLTAEHPPKAAPVFGWSSAVMIDLAIEETGAAAGDQPQSPV